MRTKNRLKSEETIYFKPEIENCPFCKEKLLYCHSVSNKTISTRSGIKKVVNMGYRCTNENCEHQKTVYRSAQAEQMSMKFITYGMDVLAYVGKLRFREHKTREEITEILASEGVVISERHVQKLYERYTLLLRASSDEYARSEFQKITEEYGGIILSMDGVQPEKGNETLYVIREVLSGTIVAAKNVKSSSTEELMNFIQPVIELGFPLLGFVSDGQKSIRLAFEKLSPDTPYQYCQFHYLKDIAKPAVDQDRKLKVNIKKNLRGIRAIEKKAMENNDLESETVLDYTAAVRSVLLEDGCPPLDLPGIKIYEQTKQIQESIEKCLKKGLTTT